MAELDCRVAGLSCREVLEALSDFVNGTLSPDEVARIRLHLDACGTCTRFGGRFAGFIAVVRRELAAGPPLDAEVAARLRARLRRERP